MGIVEWPAPAIDRGPISGIDLKHLDG
jgi:hypothetical protein